MNNFVSKIFTQSTQVFAVLVLLFLNGCQTPPPPELIPVTVTQPPKATAAKVHKVTLLLPLSGQHQAIGQSMKQAAELSLFDLADANLELSTLDTKGTVEGTLEAFKAAKDKKASLILGPVFGENFKIVKSQAQRAGIPIVGFSNDLSLIAPNTYVFGLDVDEQVKRILDFSAAKGIFDIAVILPESPYGRHVASIIDSMHKSNQINVVQVFFYTPGNQDIGEIAERLKVMNIQGLFIPEGGKQLNTLLSSLAYHDYNLREIQLLGTDQWNTPEVAFNRLALNGWFSGPSMSDRSLFESKYKASYGTEPHKLSFLAYDAVAMTAMLVRMHKHAPFNQAALTQRQGFMGVHGLFRLLRNGDTERALAVYQVKNGNAEMISPAAREFAYP